MSSIRTLSLALATAAALAAPAAFAQDSADGSAAAKRFSVVGGAALSQSTSNPEIAPGVRADVDGGPAATLSASYNINDNIAIEAWGADKIGHKVNAGAGKIATLDAQPVSLSGQYHFGAADNTFRPYVGLGYHETNFSNEDATAGGALAGQRIGVETVKGAVGTVGVDVNITPTWFARADARYFEGNSDIKVNGAKSGDVGLDPVVVGVGIGARF